METSLKTSFAQIFSCCPKVLSCQIFFWGGGAPTPPLPACTPMYSTNAYTGRLRPEVQPLTLLYTIFHEKGTPFVYLLLTNGTPFKYLVQNFASLLTAVNALSFKQESITKIERFLDLVLLGPFTDPNDRFPYHFIYFSQ